MNIQIISTQPPVLKTPIILSSDVHCRDRWTSQCILPLRCFWNHGVRKCNESAQLKQGEHIPNGELWLEKSHPLDKVIKYASVLWKGAVQISDTAAAQSCVLHLKGAHVFAVDVYRFSVPQFNCWKRVFVRNHTVDGFRWTIKSKRLDPGKNHKGILSACSSPR